MKKILMFLIAVFFAAVVLGQKTSYSEIKITAMPKNTTDWLKKNMPKSTIVKAGINTDKGVKTYMVLLDYKGNKRMVRFDKNGKYLGKGSGMTKEEEAKAKSEAIRNSGQPAQTAPDTKKEGAAEPIKK